MKIERLTDEFVFLLPVLAVKRREIGFGWLKWHWVVSW